MRIIQLTPGSGDNFYCENCLRDLALVRAFQRAGHDITMVPMYLPINTGDEPFPQQGPIFFGGLNVYLQQKFSLFQKTPRWLDTVLDNRLLLKGLGKLTGMTSPKDLGETTVSMLAGCDGRQEKELLRLADWLAEMDPKPDVIMVSNILLGGLVETLKEKVGVPVVCLLQDEEGFLDTLPAPYAQQGWDWVRRHAQAFDGLICVSDYYQQVMLDKLGVEAEKMPVIPMGIDTEEFQPASEPPEVPTIGFLSKMCYDHGLDILINTLHLLKRDNRLEHVRLRITGGRGPGDTTFLKKMQNRINTLKLTDSIEYVDHYRESGDRIRFLRSLSVMAVPMRKPPAYGLFALEACACGVPFAAPDIGVFNELAAGTQAGVLYHPNNPVRLSETLRPLLTDPAVAGQLGQKGRWAIEQAYSIDTTAKQLVDYFSELKH